MRVADLGEFRSILMRLGVVFGRQVTPELADAYWCALADQPIESVREHARRHERFSRYFPRPYELRPAGERASVRRNAQVEALESEADQRSIRNLEELRRQDPARWVREVRARHLARLCAIHGEKSPVYLDAVTRWESRLMVE